MERMDDLNLVHRDNSNLITARKRALKRKANVEKKSAFLNADHINGNNLIQMNRPSENQSNRFRVSSSLSKGNYIAKINPNIVCFSCGKVGHPANKCPKKPNLGSKNVNSKGGNRFQHGRIYIFHDRIFINRSESEFGILDSGCTTTSLEFHQLLMV
jgi:hypothetical protein